MCLCQTFKLLLALQLPWYAHHLHHLTFQPPFTSGAHYHQFKHISVFFQIVFSRLIASHWARLVCARFIVTFAWIWYLFVWYLSVLSVLCCRFYLDATDIGRFKQSLFDLYLLSLQFWLPGIHWCNNPCLCIKISRKRRNYTVFAHSLHSELSIWKRKVNNKTSSHPASSAKRLTMIHIGEHI